LEQENVLFLSPMKNRLKIFLEADRLKNGIVIIAILFSIPVFSQKNKPKNDSIAIRDSIREMMFQGALHSMDALQAKTESQKGSDLARKRQKAGESQNLFFQSRIYYRKAIAFDKNYYPAWTSLGTTYYMQDLPKMAIPCYRRALIINGDFSPAWYNLGKAYQSVGMKDSAIYSYKQSIRTDSSSVKSYQELSLIILSDEKDSSSALKLMRLAAHYQPTSEVPWVSMADIYFNYKDSANAISVLENAAKIYTGDIDRLELLANYFQRHNDQKKAAFYSNLIAVEKKKQEIPVDTDPNAGQ
jgi:tetratricopeptide (TPR) repeat protein